MATSLTLLCQIFTMADFQVRIKMFKTKVLFLSLELLIQILKSEEFYSIAEQLSITLMANTSKSVLAESLDMEVGEFDAACNAQIHSGSANGAGLLGQVMSFLVRMVVWLNLSSVGETKLSDYLQFSRFVKYTAYYTSGDKTQSKIVEATTE